MLRLRFTFIKTPKQLGVCPQAWTILLRSNEAILATNEHFYFAFSVQFDGGLCVGSNKRLLGCMLKKTFTCAKNLL